MGYVYLIGERDNDNIFKIGVTKSDNINLRKNKLQTGNPDELYIKDYFKSDYPFKVETMLHKQYMNENKINEWFMLNENDVKNFKNNCEKYENIFKSLSDNPFFNK